LNAPYLLAIKANTQPKIGIGEGWCEENQHCCTFHCTDATTDILYMLHQLCAQQLYG
jgi:hypothetical protein